MKKEYDFTKGKRGPAVRARSGKSRITIRIDDDILEWFRERVRESGGGNYQTLINEALRRCMDMEQGDMEDLMRRVLREELASYETVRRVRRRAPRKGD